MITYYAHKSEEGKTQSIVEHAEGVEKLIREFTANTPCGSLAPGVGRYHDVGKYSPDFQARINGEGISYEHSSAGAELVFEKKKSSKSLAQNCAGTLMAYAIAGHHSGLPDYGSAGSSSDDSTLIAKLLRREKIGDDYSEYRQELGEIPELPLLDEPFCPKTRVGEKWFSYQFLGRMLFSALVDADYLDTEAFMRGGTWKRDSGESFNVLYERFALHMQQFERSVGKLNENRRTILQACIGKAMGERGVYSLSVPTGGGKTLSSMAFALEHLKKQKMRRIIYVIPYVSIISQTVQVFQSIFGKENVLGHYATADFWKKKAEHGEQPSQEELASENWDKPIIVTTNVQFFESLYANKPSRCRKLHNIADSVVIFDEVQMLPIPILKPCVQAIAELSKNYGCTCVLCTATQPAFDDLLEDCDVTAQEICPNIEKMYADFRRVRYEWCGRVSDDAVFERLNDCNAALCVLNTKRTTREYYDALHIAGTDDGVYHLSTYMTPRDISKTIAEIQSRLAAIRNGTISGRCIVVSTSLIEAGVDIDFPNVFREIVGLDSIIQSGGRCNREGRRSPDDSVVYVFEREKVPRGLDEVCDFVRREFERARDIASPDVMHRYFEKIYGINVPDNKDIRDRYGILPLITHKEKGYDVIPYHEIAARFHYIDQHDQKLILIQNAENRELCDIVRDGRLTRGVLRALAGDMVSLYEIEYRQLMDQGVLTHADGGIAILEDDWQHPRYYDPKCGLRLSVEQSLFDYSV